MSIEATIYRRALIELNKMAVDNRRKVLSREDVRDITQRALEIGVGAAREEVQR